MSKAEKTADTAEKNEKQNKKPWWLLLLLLLLIALTLLTSVIVVVRIGNFLPDNMDVIFLVPKKSSFVIDDGKKVWTTDTEIELFSLSYVDDNGIVTVRSDSGNHLFAPGTENSYTFSLKNTGNMAVDFQMNIDLKISLGEFSELPVLMKLERGDGSYVFGGADEWVGVKEVTGVSDKHLLGPGRYTEYTLSWKWEFENGNDRYDTELGSASASSDISMSLAIGTYAEIIEKGNVTDGEIIIDEKTGLPIEPEDVQHGGEFKLPEFLILLIILIIVAVGFTLGCIMTRRKTKKKGTPDGTGK